MPVFSSIVAILFSLNCQKQDYDLKVITLFADCQWILGKPLLFYGNCQMIVRDFDLIFVKNLFYLFGQTPLCLPVVIGCDPEPAPGSLTV